MEGRCKTLGIRDRTFGPRRAPSIEQQPSTSLMSFSTVKFGTSVGAKPDSLIQPDLRLWTWREGWCGRICLGEGGGYWGVTGRGTDTGM